MRDVYEILREMEVMLPTPPAKGGVYTPVQEFGEKFLYCSGCGPALADGQTVIGTLGRGSDRGRGAEGCLQLCAEPAGQSP